jgi:acyl-CoA thioester hydrolase
MKNFQWPIRVYYEDTDAGGVVYYANYLRFYERARTEFLRTHGYEQDQLRDQEQLIFAVRTVEVDYLRPARFNQSLQVSAEIANTRGASIWFRQQITLTDEPEQILSTAHIRVVCIHAETFRARPIPNSMIKKIQHYV